MIYRTGFSLTRPVTDFDEAKKWLLEQPVKRMFDYSPLKIIGIPNKVNTIKYVLETEQEGYIEFDTMEVDFMNNGIFTEKEIKQISDWLKNLNSINGLIGELFCKCSWAYESGAQFQKGLKYELEQV